ncbi:MAG: cation transporter [Cytophagales bacterium]
MYKTTFKISKMDCASEEHIIRMTLAELPQIKSLEFDIPDRKLTVFHDDDNESILKRLKNLNFETSLIECIAVNPSIITNDNTQKERKLLWMVLIINFFLFALELTTGFFANSLGLLADSLDMLADSIVYALALLAVGRTIARKKKVAKFAGYFQLILVVLGFTEVVRRFLGFEEIPDFETMIFVSILALIGNAYCMYLLQKNKSKEAHIQASMIFTSNDIIVNIGVILAGLLVFITKSKYPDFFIGIIVFFIVGKGAFNILKLSK